MRTLLPLLLAIPFPAAAQEAPSPARLRGDVGRLVAFGTRHTLSSPDDAKRGIGAARRWAAGELTRISDACAGCIVSANIAKTFTGPRAPKGVEVVDVLGFQQGVDPKRVVIVGAHIDSRVTDALDATSDAPGANDNASGVALVLEAARILSKEKFPATIVYAIFSGEEQGLWGAQLLAETARQRGWTVTAMLNNDIVGGVTGPDGVRDDTHVRVFSEGIRASEDLAAQMDRRGDGGEDDGPSRALAKAIDAVAATLPGGLDVFVDRRPDRFGRGGDHEPFLDLGFPAVRFSSAVENWDQQHQNVRTENGRRYGDTIDGVDFSYLAKVAAIDVATIRRLASAPAAPVTVTVEGALTRDSTLNWHAVPGAATYRVYWRRTDAGGWTDHRDVSAPTAVIADTPVDDHFFGVAAVAANGVESIVTLAGASRQ